MDTGNNVEVFDEYVLGEEEYKERPLPVFDGPNGLPAGWHRMEATTGSVRTNGAVSNAAAVVPRKGKGVSST